MVLSARDGRELGERPVDDLEHRWTTWGRHVLAWMQESLDKPLVLRLYDAWTGDEIWREAFPIGTRATLVEEDEVAAFQPDGRLVIRSLRDAAVNLEASLEPEEKLETVHVLRSSDTYLIVTNRDGEASADSHQVRIRAITGGGAVPLVTGRMYSLDRTSGQPNWKSPVEIEQFGLPVSQPPDSPVVMLLRHVVPNTSQGTRRQHTEVLVLDRRDGRVLMNRDDIPAQTATFAVVADPLKHAVLVSLPVKSFRLQFTDDPIPPEPPAEEETETVEAEAE
jgi:outer membrane protein assembly factor BamB